METLTAPTPLTQLTKFIQPDQEGNLSISNYAHYKSLERSLQPKDTLDLPIIQTVSRQLGEAEVMKLLYVIVEEGVRPFKVVHKMDARDIISLCSDFLDLHRTETPEDLIIFFKKARTGIYGEAFNRLDGPTLLKWFTLYLDEKAKAREDQQKNRKAEISKELAHPDIYKGLAKSLEATKRPDPGPAPQDPKGQTFESMVKTLEANVETMATGTLSALKTQLHRENRLGAYNEPLELINNELEKRGIYED